jgi:RNA polymerase sigma-70 factor (ECF subfamily)
MNVTRSITQVKPPYSLSQAEEVFQSAAAAEMQDVYLEPDGNVHEQVLSLYKEYRPNLYAYVRSQYLSPDEAEDVIQETFLRLANKLLLKVKIENIRGWVVHVAHHLAVDVIRRRDRDAARISHVSDFEFENFKAQGADPEGALLEREQQQEIELALSRLTPQQRQCFQMRAEGFRYKDIGTALGISEQRAQLVVKQVTIRLAAAISG